MLPPSNLKTFNFPLDKQFACQNKFSFIFNRLTLKVYFLGGKCGKEANRKQETGNRKQETGNRKQETGNRKQETGNRKHYCAEGSAQPL